MYGTTMRNYNVNKASGNKDEKKSIFAKKIKVSENKKSKKLQDTRYIKIESNKEVNKVEETSNAKMLEENSFSRKDFPIPSVIITVLLTMMLLVVASGLFGM